MIKFLDLQKINLQYKEEIKSKLIDVFTSGWYLQGEENKLFEKKLSAYLNVPFVIGVANGLDALRLILKAYMALGVMKEGDEIIVPANTYIASILAITDNRLVPVFIEPAIYNCNLDSTKIEEKITPKTKAIVPVHLYGQAANMEAIMKIAAVHNLAVIEDNAQAIGCEVRFSDGAVKKTGSIGTIGTTSFFPSKNLGGYGDGGAIMTNNDELAAKIKMIANHGQSKRYYHDMVGCNSRLDTIQAAVLEVKLKYLDEYIAARQKVAAYYNQAFADNPHITVPFRAGLSANAWL